MTLKPGVQECSVTSCPHGLSLDRTYRYHNFQHPDRKAGWDRQIVEDLLKWVRGEDEEDKEIEIRTPHN